MHPVEPGLEIEPLLEDGIGALRSMPSYPTHRCDEAIVVLLEPVLNPLWTYLVVGEAVPGPTRVGGPLILAGVLAWMLMAVPRRRGDAAAPARSGNDE